MKDNLTARELTSTYSERAKNREPQAYRVRSPFKILRVAIIAIFSLSLQSHASSECLFGDTPSDDGKRRLALIVGVGSYPSLKDADLAGPENDAKKFHVQIWARQLSSGRTRIFAARRGKK